MRAKIKGKTYCSWNDNLGDEMVIEADNIEIIPEDKPKREVKEGDFGVAEDGNVVVVVEGKNVYWENRYKFKLPILGNLFEMVEEMKKVKAGETETIDGFKAYLSKLGVDDIVRFCGLKLSKSDARRFACQLLALAREET